MIYLKKDNTDKIKKRYNRIAPIYDICESIMEKVIFSRWRKALWEKIDDFNKQENKIKILEVGVGTGKNIPYYPKGAKVYAVDFSPEMLKIAEKKAEKYEKELELIEMDIQSLDFADDFFDVIVSTCVFCSVPDPIKGFQELKRVCKPEGKIFLLEHMRSQKEILGLLMDKLNWISYFLWGANINRETKANVKQTGLKIVEEKDLWLDIVKEIVLIINDNLHRDN